jgi:hypothetical protein
MALVACASCLRHYRASESACPFCRAKGDATARAIAIALAVAAAACNSTPKEIAQPYGVPVPIDGGRDQPPVTQPDSGQPPEVAAPYGVPIPIDGGRGQEPPPMRALYGAPPPADPNSPRK